MSNAKYDADYPGRLLRVEQHLSPRATARVLALDDDDFTGTPTRWTFSP